MTASISIEYEPPIEYISAKDYCFSPKYIRVSNPGLPLAFSLRHVFHPHQTTSRHRTFVREESKKQSVEEVGNLSEQVRTMGEFQGATWINFFNFWESTYDTRMLHFPTRALRANLRFCGSCYRVRYRESRPFLVYDLTSRRLEWSSNNNPPLRSEAYLFVRQLRRIRTSFSTSTREDQIFFYDVKIEKRSTPKPGADEERRKSKEEKRKDFSREARKREERVSRGLTLLALGIIRPAKEIGIARNSWEGVEFHMKYTWHLLPSPAGPLQRRKRIINRSPPSAPFRPSPSLFLSFSSVFFFLRITRLLTLRLFGREAQRLRKVPEEGRKRDGREEGVTVRPQRPHRPLQSGL